MDELQQRILEEMDAFAGRFPAIKALYLFGSIARGTYHAWSDIDIAAEWQPGFDRDPALAESYIDFQDAHGMWADSLRSRFGREVDFVRTAILAEPQHGAAVWPAILEAAKHPLDQVGKAFMVWTDRLR